MTTRCLLILLTLACGLSLAGSAEEDLEFAQRLGALGLQDMALSVLDRLEKSSDPEQARAGRYGKALLTKQQATRARNLFLLDIEEGNPPRMTREQVIALYQDARPKIEEYVSSRQEADEARFLLGEILMEYGEFLTGADYPEELEGERSKLIEANKDQASQLFEKAVENFRAVYDHGAQVLATRAAVEPDDPLYIRVSTAEFNIGVAHYRWALIFPKGANFQYRIDQAIEDLDTFYNKHYDDLFGAYALVYLGRAFLERGVRMGEPDSAQTAADYFEMVYKEVREDPAVPETADVIGRSFYWYIHACNALASGEGALPKAQPIYYENSINAVSTLRQKLKQGAQSEWALRALLEVADAYAAQRNYDEAVGLAGEVLAAARVEAARKIGKTATAKLTRWVASVRGAGVLGSSLLFQIGESLATQGRIGNAITFFEKAIAAADTVDAKERYAYPAQLRIAALYRADKRFFAAAGVAWGVVEEFLKSGQADDTDFGLTAGEACYQASIAMRTIADNTKRPEHEARYREILELFRDKFPGHPANSDAAFSQAVDTYNRGNLQSAANEFRAISPSSRNYWLAQRRVPLCYRRLALEDNDASRATEWHRKCLESARALVEEAAKKPEDPAAVRARQEGALYVAMAFASLEQWEDALTAIDGYLAAYPDDLLKRGLEYDIKVHAHLALGQVDEAEAALATLREKAPDSAYVRQCARDTYTALKDKYKPMGTGQERQAIAARAAKLLEEVLAAEPSLNESHYFALGDVMRDARRWQDAGDAFEAAAGVVAEGAKKSGYKLFAAEMQFKAAKEGNLSRQQYLEVLTKTRELFTDVLIDDKAAQGKVLQSLSNWQGYPSKDIFDKIKRSPTTLLTAAEVYMESSPTGMDGRWIATRLIAHLHSFTRPTTDPTNPALDEYIPLWWDGAELVLQAYLAIAESGTGQDARTAREKGKALAGKITFTYKDMDGPERVTRISELKRKLEG